MKNHNRALSCALCIVFFASGGCNKTKSPAEKETPPDKRYSLVASTDPPAPGESPPDNPANAPAAPGLDLDNLVKFVGPAVVLVSVFDPSGKLLTTRTGFFVADDGRFVTAARVVEGGANAVAKAADGKIYNVTGVLGTSNALDLAVLQAEAKRVPFLPLNPAVPKPATPLAVIGSPLAQKTRPPLEIRISDNHPDANEDRLELTAPLVKDLGGSPVVDGNGEVVGIVTTAGGEGEAPVVIRTSSARNQLLASIPPDASARWAATVGNTPQPPPPPWADEKSPTPIPLAPVVSRLVHTPAPIYPMGARFSRPPIKGSGRFRVTFAATGEAMNVQVVQSTGSPLLDGSAVSALRQWRSAPGREWTTNVPVTFGR